MAVQLKDSNGSALDVRKLLFLGATNIRAEAAPSNVTVGTNTYFNYIYRKTLKDYLDEVIALLKADLTSITQHYDLGSAFDASGFRHNFNKIRPSFRYSSQSNEASAEEVVSTHFKEGSDVTWSNYLRDGTYFHTASKILRTNPANIIGTDWETEKDVESAFGAIKTKIGQIEDRIFQLDYDVDFDASIVVDLDGTIDSENPNVLITTEDNWNAVKDAIVGYLQKLTFNTGYFLNNKLKIVIRTKLFSWSENGQTFYYRPTVVTPPNNYNLDLSLGGVNASGNFIEFAFAFTFYYGNTTFTITLPTDILPQVVFTNIQVRGSSPQFKIVTSSESPGGTVLIIENSRFNGTLVIDNSEGPRSYLYLRNCLALGIQMIRTGDGSVFLHNVCSFLANDLSNVTLHEVPASLYIGESKVAITFDISGSPYKLEEFIISNSTVHLYSTVEFYNLFKYEAIVRFSNSTITIAGRYCFGDYKDGIHRPQTIYITNSYVYPAQSNMSLPSGGLQAMLGGRWVYISSSYVEALGLGGASSVIAAEELQISSSRIYIFTYANCSVFRACKLVASANRIYIDKSYIDDVSIFAARSLSGIGTILSAHSNIITASYTNNLYFIGGTWGAMRPPSPSIYETHNYFPSS
ncbi:MAG: hypothetical protein QXY76_03290 [Nitrososphaeria archaeon]